MSLANFPKVKRANPFLLEDPVYITTNFDTELCKYVIRGHTNAYERTLQLLKEGQYEYNASKITEQGRVEHKELDNSMYDDSNVEIHAEPDTCMQYCTEKPTDNIQTKSLNSSSYNSTCNRFSTCDDYNRLNSTWEQQPFVCNHQSSSDEVLQNMNSGNMMCSSKPKYTDIRSFFKRRS